MRQYEKELKVLELRKEGYTYGQICKELGLSKSLVAYYCKRKEIERIKNNQIIKEKNQKEYEQLVCEIISHATNMNDLCKLMGKRSTNNNYLHFERIIKKYNLDTSHFSSLPKNKTRSSPIISDSEYFIIDNNKLKQGNLIKQRLLSHNLKKYECECCHNTEWNSQPIPLELHHINGNRYDNTLENLQLLCPNCHAQTDNYAGKNINKKKQTYICKECGKKFHLGEGSTKNSTLYCSIECKNINSINKIKFSIEQLIEDYRELGSFSKIGEKYNVSDNTIKKWFKKYELPFKAHDIRQYIINLYGKQPQWYSYMYEENGNRKNMFYKKVEVYTKDNNFLRLYNTVNDAANDLKLSNPNAIRSVCRGRLKQYKGYIFKYYEE